MRQLILALCAALAACAPRLTADVGVYRARSAPIYSNAGFDFSQLQGSWDQVAGFAGSDDTACQPGGATFLPKGGMLGVRYSLCLSGKTVTGAGTVSPTGPGRFAVSGTDGIGQDWWVLWVDEGYRTLAIGNPDGAFGFILNRGETLPGDRLVAARQVLDFNGYSVEKLVVLGR